MGAKDKRGGGPTPGSDKTYTGPLESVNDTKRTGRDDGFHANQRRTGHKSEDSEGEDLATGANREKRRRPWVATNRGEDLPRLPEKEVRRTDSVQEIQP